jgi:hypothetical protein
MEIFYSLLSSTKNLTGREFFQSLFPPSLYIRQPSNKNQHEELLDLVISTITIIQEVRHSIRTRRLRYIHSDMCLPTGEKE